MGKGAYIRIQNKSSLEVTTAIHDREEVDVDEEDMKALQGTLPVGGSFPTKGQAKFGRRYQYIEGEKSFFLQKDGAFKLIVNVNGGEASASATFGVNASDWWCEGTTVTGPVMIATDVEEADDQFRIELRIYNAVNFTSWMGGELAECIENKPLCQVGLPGTHDSGTYVCDPGLIASPDSDLTMTIQDKLEGGGKGIFSKIGAAINDQILEQVFERLCKCQDKSFKEQLQGGIRYLDLRVARREDNGKFYTCHGVYCVDMETAMEEINAFLNENPKEIVLLDFNHLYAMDGHHNELVDKVLAILGDKVADSNTLKPNSKVGDYWNAGAQAVITYYHPETVAAYDGKIWSHKLISSPWPNTTETDALHDKLNDNVQNRSLNKFFVLQGLLTPDGELIKDEIMESKTGTSLKSIACRVNPKVCDWVEDEWSNDQTHNVVICDFFENCSMVAAVVNWNRK